MRNLSLASETSKKKDVQYCSPSLHGVSHAAVGGGALPGAPPLPLPRLHHHHQLPPVAVQPSGSKRFEPKTLQDCFVGTFANLCPVTNCPYLR